MKIPNDGRFKRKHHHWSPDNFSDGWVGKKSGRFMVYFPEHPKANEMGYVTRALAVIQFYYGISPKKGFVIHHINQDRLDDSIENLQIMTKKAHDAHHIFTQRIGFYRNCFNCKKEFYIPRWRLKDGRPGISCSNTTCSAKAIWVSRRKKCS